MRLAYLTLLLLAACSDRSNPADAWVGTYREERDALCVAHEGEALKASLITYGDEDANCSISGRAEIREDTLIVIPRGDSDCSVEIRISNGIASLGARSRACDYYCGPGADYSGRALRKMSDAATKVTDFAGDPLC